MPTGYTADIKDGITFQTFAMNCARAFGACISLRDEGGDGHIIPEKFEPSDYHLKAQEQARAKLSALDNMTPAECDRAAAKAWDDSETNRLMRLREIADQRAAYEAMLKRVNAWAPPTSDHKELQSFMRSQIEESIRFDCGTTYYETPAERVAGSVWLARQREQCAKDIAYHETKHAEEIERAASRTAWVVALRQSLTGA